MNDNEDIDDVMHNRELARKAVNRAAGRGHDLAGMLISLEELAHPFFLGIDEDECSEDMDVFP